MTSRELKQNTQLAHSPVNIVKTVICYKTALMADQREQVCLFSVAAAHKLFHLTIDSYQSVYLLTENKLSVLGSCRRRDANLSIWM